MLVFLFTDIEGSTRLWEQYTGEMGAVIERHDELLREQITAHGGRVTKHTGDGVTAAFEGGEPVACALETQVSFAAESWDAIGELRIRIGLHAGEAEWLGAPGGPGGDYHGPPVNCAARIMSAAWGGQILLTPEVTRVSHLPRGAALLDLGEHLLKNVSAPQQLFQLVHADLPGREFPPPRTLSGQSIRQAVGEQGTRMASLAPPDMAVVLVSATLLPAVLGEQPAGSAALAGNVGVLRDLGAEALAEFLGQFAEHQPVGTPEEIREDLERELRQTWASDVTLRADASRLLRAVHGVEATLMAATGKVKGALARGLAVLGEQFDEFRWMLGDVQETLGEVRARQELQLALQREQLDLQQRQLARTEELLERQAARADLPALGAVLDEVDEKPYVPGFLTAEEVEGRERPPFVAREAELARLNGFLERALTGRGRVVFVTGDAGQGKTALLAEFARRAMVAQPDLLVASGNCDAYSGIGDPFLPFRDAMGMLTGDVETRWSAGDISRDHALRLWGALPLAVQAVAEHGPHVVPALVSGPPLLSRALAVAPAGAPWLRQLRARVERGQGEPEGLEQSALFQQVTNVLRALAEAHPLLLILDDLQWADSASIGLLFHLGRRLEGSRMLVVGAYRPEEVTLGREGEAHRQVPVRHQRMPDRNPLEQVLAELKRVYGDVWLDLAEVEEPEGRRFVDALLETEPNRLGEGFRRALFEHTGGHPLFTVELLRAMQERGDLVRDEGGWWIEGPALDWDTLPARVEGVIEARIGRLEEELRETLTVASVEGEEFTAQVVARVQELGERQTLRSLARELDRRHRLVREQQSVAVGHVRLSRYRFAHALFQQYLYDDLSDGERTLLHGEVAGVLEELYQGHLEGVAVHLARHFSEAGDDGRALKYLILAGDGALAAYANREAEGHFRAALELADTEARRADLLGQLGRVLDHQGRYSEAMEAWREGINLYQALGMEEGVARLYARTVHAATMVDPAEALRLAREGLGAVARSLQSPDYADLLHETARACWLNGLPEEAVSLSRQALEMAERLGDVRIEAEALCTLGIYLPHAESLSALTRAIKLAESAGLLGQAFRAHNNMGAVVAGGDARACREHMLRAAEFARQMGAILEELYGTWNAAFTSLFLGDLAAADEALPSMRQLLDTAESSRRMAIRLPMLEAMLLRYKGKLTEAVDRLRTLRIEARGANDLQALLGIDEELAITCLWEGIGEQEELEDVLREGSDLAERQVERKLVVFQCLLAVQSARRGESEAARHLLAEARRQAVVEGRAVEWEPTVLWATALVVAAERRWTEAVAAFEAAADGLDGQQRRWYRARTLIDWAEAHLTRGESGDRERAREILQEAEDEFEAMGAPIYAERVRTRLRELGDESSA